MWSVAFLFAAAAGALLAELGNRRQPDLIIVCERGGVTRDVSHVASGSGCVLTDRFGSATTAGSISIYQDDMAVP
jgi:hypothetical protein